jgi:HD-GYP domain-containing protein (c-di-GMP phosphodiesterase class II)
LDYDERLAVEAHAEIGASILGRIEGYEEIALAVRHHHERYDGVGYPDECRGEEIPILARLVAVADAYSAMTSERPYRTALASAEAQNRIKREAGKQFDRDVVRAFLSLLDQASEAYVSGTDSNFAIEIGEVIALEGEMSLAVHR